MALKEDIENKIDAYFDEPYDIAETTIVPSTDYSKLTFGNKGLVAELCFLFVDIRKSSKLHDVYGLKNAARIYQSFHDINVRIINSLDGEVRAFDGDRIMAVFSGESKCSNSVQAGMKIIWSIRNILNKKINPKISCGIGIDFGKTLITKVGKGRNVNNNDLVWVGQACNYASHYCQEADNSVIISNNTFNRISKSCKFSSKNENMWSEVYIELKNKTKISCYETTWEWSI